MTMLDESPLLRVLAPLARSRSSWCSPLATSLVALCAQKDVLREKVEQTIFGDYPSRLILAAQREELRWADVPDQTEPGALTLELSVQDAQEPAAYAAGVQLSVLGFRSTWLRSAYIGN